MAKVMGDLEIKRTLTADRRADQGANTEVLSGNRTVVRHDFAWLNLDAGASNRNVTLPDATLLPLGWKIVVSNVGVANSLVVKDGAAGSLKTIGQPSDDTPGAFEFVLTDNGDAGGAWYIHMLTSADDDAATSASRFVATFADTDFPGASGGYNTLTGSEISGLLAATHGRGVNPMIMVQEGAGPFDKVMVDQERMSAAGDITLRVSEGSEFSGRVVMV